LWLKRDELEKKVNDFQGEAELALEEELEAIIGLLQNDLAIVKEMNVNLISVVNAKRSEIDPLISEFESLAD
jgi:hypothetical protein